MRVIPSMMIRRRRRVSSVLLLLPLFFSILFMTFCDTSFTNAIIRNTVIILATIITRFSSIKWEKKRCIAVLRFILRVLTHRMDYNQKCTLYSLLTLFLATDGMRWRQSSLDNTVVGDAAPWTRLSALAWNGISATGTKTDPVIQTRRGCTDRVRVSS